MKYNHVSQSSEHGGNEFKSETFEEENSETQYQSYAADAIDMLNLAIPIAISRLAWVGMKTTDTALIGHTGTTYLSASAISDLWMQRYLSSL